MEWGGKGKSLKVKTNNKYEENITQTRSHKSHSRANNHTPLLVLPKFFVSLLVPNRHDFNMSWTFLEYNMNTHIFYIIDENNFHASSINESYFSVERNL
jgi:hypothetical protein